MSVQASDHKRGFVALGAILALDGVVARVALVAGAVTVLAGVVVAVLLGRGPNARPPLELVPSLTASATAWTAGLLLSFAAATRALLRDRDDGIRQLASARGASPSLYLWGRISGLGAALFVVVGGSALLAGVASLLAARQAALAGNVALATIASLLYAAAFAAVMSPLTVAVLGARSRTGGYFGLLLFLFLPEMLLGLSQELVPEPWAELASVPSALAALRGALMPHAFDPERFLRAGLVLAAVAAVSLLYVKQQLARVDRERALIERRP